MRELRDRIQQQVAKAVVGLEDTVDHLVAAIVVGVMLRAGVAISEN